MKTNQLKQLLHPLLVTAGVGLVGAFSAQAQTTLSKANNNLGADQAGSWSPNAVPTSLDTVVWDSTVSTAANCTNTPGTALNWGSVQVLNPAAPVTVTSSTLVLSLYGANGVGIDLNQPSCNQSLWLNLPLTIPAGQPAQEWAIKPGQTLRLGNGNNSSGQPTVLQSDVTLKGYAKVAGKDLRVSSGATLTIPEGSTLEFLQAGDTPLSVAYFGNGLTGSGTVNQSGGLVLLYRTSAKACLFLGTGGALSGSGTYNLNGGALIDTNSPSGAFVMLGDGGNYQGILNVKGGTMVVPAIQVGNSGSGVINVYSGALTNRLNDLILSKGTSAQGGALNVYGGVVSIPGNTLAVGKGNSSTGPATVYQNGGLLVVGGSSGVQVPSGSPQPATVTLEGGAMSVTNDLTLLSSGTGDGTLNLNSGGALTVRTIARGTGTGVAAVNLNGGTLKARSGQNSFIAATLPVKVLEGGAVIDSAGFDITIPAALASGASPDGGLTKLGAGALTLSGANSYTGPTVVQDGALSLTTTNHGGGDISVNNAARLRVTLGANGTTLNCSALALGSVPAGSGGVVTNEFNFNGLPNPSQPVLDAASLQASGTVYINVLGSSGLTDGTIPLIHYGGSVAGSDYAFVLATPTVGIFNASLKTNTAAHTIEIVLSSFVPQKPGASLTWRSLVDTNWDGLTANWIDQSDSSVTTYGDNSTVLFDDSASSTTVNLAFPASPAAVLFNNSSKAYTFSGTGRIGGTNALTLLGSGVVVMSLPNDYSGSTVISNGTFRLGTNNVIPNGTGRGDVLLEGKLDMAGFTDTINGLAGYNGVVDNSAALPALLGVGSGNSSGSFSGLITNSGAPLTLDKSGSGSLTLLRANAYSGGTTNRGGGVLQLAADSSVGTGPLILGSGILGWTDGAAHTLTNKLIITANTAFGLPGNGPLTVADTADFAGGNRTLNCTNDVLLQNGLTNGALGGKDGPATLTLKNTTCNFAGGSFRISNGTLVLSNSVFVQDNGNFRVQCAVPGGLSRLLIRSGASLIVSNSSTANFRAGAGDVSGVPGCTNILDVFGTLKLIAYTGTDNRLLIGGTNAADIVNLRAGGVIEARQVSQTGSSYREFNFNGGTLRASAGNLGSTFMPGLDACYVLDGGAIVDSAGFDLTIGANLLLGGSGAGGLTKQGLGALRLNGVNTYTGPTLVMAGSLGGTGVISGPVTIQSGAGFAPGAALGTLRIDNTLTLQSGSTTTMEISKDSGAPLSGSVTGVSTLSYGGTLVVTNTGTNSLYPLAAGDVFYLFSAATKQGAFGSFTLPALPPTLTWDTTQLAVDGSLRVVDAPATPPSFGATHIQGGNLVMSGSGGTPGSGYSILTQTNVTLPMSYWSVAASGVFAADGHFTNTLPVNATPASQFYRLRVP